MWELDYEEGWVAECQRTDAFELWCWRTLWPARRSNQSILKETNPEYSLEGQILKLKPQYLATCCEELTHWKRPWWCEEWGQEEKGVAEDEMVRELRWLNLSRLWEIVKDREAWREEVHGATKNQTQLSDWTTTTKCPWKYKCLHMK